MQSETGERAVPVIVIVLGIINCILRWGSLTFWWQFKIILPLFKCFCRYLTQQGPYLSIKFNRPFFGDSAANSAYDEEHKMHKTNGRSKKKCETLTINFLIISYSFFTSFIIKNCVVIVVACIRKQWETGENLTYKLICKIVFIAHGVMGYFRTGFICKLRNEHWFIDFIILRLIRGTVHM